MFPTTDLVWVTRKDAMTLVVSPDGQSYWAWCRTESAFCFGIASRDGEAFDSYYADLGPPRQGDDDDRWVHEFDDLPPDWSH